MNALGFLALLVAAGIAVWLLLRVARGDGLGGEARNVTILKVIVWLGLAAALFAAKLAPLALMVLFAAGGVTAIEIWRDRAIKAEGKPENGPTGASAPAALSPKMTSNEAASILGVDETADASAVKAAHKKLISQLHPDKGGTDYLAAKINDARDTLLSTLPPPQVGSDQP